MLKDKSFEYINCVEDDLYFSHSQEVNIKMIPSCSGVALNYHHQMSENHH